MLNSRPLLVYDGICNLCTIAVRFLHALERGRLIRYLPSQMLSLSQRRRYRLSAGLLRGRMYLIVSDRAVLGGTLGIVAVCKLLSGFGSICSVLGTEPAQRFYEWVARRRYRLFGCRDACYLVSPSMAPPEGLVAAKN